MAFDSPLDPDVLLGRPTRPEHSEEVRSLLSGATVLVTGAGGSIGSELVRQVAECDPATIIMLDQDEYGLHRLQLELTDTALLTDDTIVLADIRDAGTIRSLIIDAKPGVVFHAAAVKHLPLLERFPAQAFRTNILGTRNVADACALAGVQRLVNISTDKAASPTSILGLSKRLAEFAARAYASEQTRVASVRFGNVLGSRGSFLPILEWQLARSRDLTIVDPDVTRFFMSIPEAVSLVLESATMANDGETYVLDMGSPIRILDLVQRVVDLTGSTPPNIRITGLRPGEKLAEQLWSGGEEPVMTPHPRIRSTRVADPAICRGVLEQLAALDVDIAPEQLVSSLWAILHAAESTAPEADILMGRP